jgi:hypothetical protein
VCENLVLHSTHERLGIRRGIVVAGRYPRAMSFRVKGVPAVVTLGRDGRWSELSGRAAVSGARVHLHLDHDRADTADVRFR